MQTISRLILALALLILAGCEDQSSTQSTQSTQASQSNNSPGSRSTSGNRYIEDAVWPPPAESVVSAADPLAMNYYVILDSSGSMSKQVGGAVKMESAKRAMTQFARETDPAVNLGLAFFSPQHEVVPLGTGNRDAFVGQIAQAAAKGGTPLVEAMHNAYKALTAQAQRQIGYGRYQMIVVTDGQSGDGDPTILAREISSVSPIEVHVIGFGIAGHSLDIPGITNYLTASSGNELIAALRAVAQAETEAFSDPTTFLQAP